MRLEDFYIFAGLPPLKILSFSLVILILVTFGAGLFLLGHLRRGSFFETYDAVPLLRDNPTTAFMPWPEYFRASNYALGVGWPLLGQLMYRFDFRSISKQYIWRCRIYTALFLITFVLAVFITVIQLLNHYWLHQF